jgi:hypothetical protein
MGRGGRAQFTGNCQWAEAAGRNITGNIGNANRAEGLAIEIIGIGNLCGIHWQYHWRCEIALRARAQALMSHIRLAKKNQVP